MQSNDRIIVSDVVRKWWGRDFRDPDRWTDLRRRFQDDPARLLIIDNAFEAGPYQLLS
jgi:hypothetical protein